MEATALWLNENKPNSRGQFGAPVFKYDNPILTPQRTFR